MKNLRIYAAAATVGLLVSWPVFVAAFGLEPPPFHRPPLERFSISATRWEKGSAYFVNAGLPWDFFNGVETPSEVPLVRSIRSVEYSLRASVWPIDRVQLQAAFPYESVHLVPVEGIASSREIKKGGDLELGTTALLAGTRRSPFYAGLHLWLRLPTGTNPFDLPFPLMSTGRGAVQWAAGVLGGQQAGRFSLYEGLNYEKTGPVALPRYDSWGHPASFRWPDTLHAAARLEFRFFRRSYRAVDLFYDLRLRRTGETRYGDVVLVEADRLWYSSFGMVVKVDPEFSVTGQYCYFPFEFSDKARPDWGSLLFLTVSYTPWR